MKIKYSENIFQKNVDEYKDIINSWTSSDLEKQQAQRELDKYNKDLGCE